MHTLIAAALAYLAPAPFPPPPPSAAFLARTHEFASLPLRQAQQLQGRLACFRIVLDSAEGTDGQASYDCRSSSTETRTVAFATLDEDEQQPGEVLRVLAVLTIVYHPPSQAADGTRFRGFTEVRLTRAVSVAALPAQ